LPDDEQGSPPAALAELPAPKAKAKPSNTFSGVNSVPAVAHWDTSAQVVITTTESEMRNILHKHLDAMISREQWVAPLTVVLSIVVALIAGVESDRGNDLLLVGLGMSLLWFGHSAKQAWKHRKHSGVDAVIADLKPVTVANRLSASGPKK
jgi:hypothetical protein